MAPIPCHFRAKPQVQFERGQANIGGRNLFPLPQPLCHCFQDLPGDTQEHSNSETSAIALRSKCVF